MNPSFISLIGIMFGVLGANFIFFLNKSKYLGLTGSSIVGVFSSVLFIKIISHLVHLESNPSILLITLIFLGAFVVGFIFSFLTKKMLLKLKI